MKARIWGVLVGLLISLSVVSAQSGGWVWQNNGSTLTTSTPNSASAVTIWNKNSSGCTLTLKSGAAGTTVVTVCGTSITLSGTVAVPSANCYGWSTDTFLQRVSAANVGISATCGGANTGTLTAGVINTTGSITASGGTSDVTAGRDLNLGAGRYVVWAGSSLLGSPANGVFQFWNGAANSGVRLDVVTTNNVAAFVSSAGADTAIVKASQFVGTAIPAIGANTGQILLLKSDGTFTTDGTTLTWDSSSDLMSVNGLAVFANGVRSAGGVDVSLGTANSGSNVFVKGSTGAVSINSAGYTYADRPSVSNGYGYAVITDSNTDTWGATVAGGGSFKILAFYNGTNWTVAGK